MLDLALQFLSDELSSYIVARTGSDLVKCTPTRIVDDTGKYAFSEGIGASLINLEEERVVKEHLPKQVYTNGQHVVRQPELKMNLGVIFAANFKFYDQALKYLSFVLTFFQSHPSFSPSSHPALDSHIQKLVVELQSPGYEQLNQIWAFIGGKHLPSAIYRVRMVILEDEEPSAIQPPITTITTTTHGR